MKLILFSLLILAFASPVVSAAGIQSDSRLDDLAQSDQWKRILHYNRFFPWSGVHGEVDGAGFYLATDGRDAPLAELKATLHALDTNQIVGKLKQPARCAYPERLRFVQKELGAIYPTPKAGECEFYDRIIGPIHPLGLSIVFSSAFSGSPGSMFGHTLFKIKTANKSDLLDKGISFAATVPQDEGGLLYIVLGLLGGYKGEYSFQAYHEKVNEYVNSESRDLWEYTLNFTPDETKRLLDNIWELESNSWYDYYFINKNCSYQLLTAIEIVKPTWDLSSGWLWVVPAETVKRIARIPGAITDIRFRPSLQKKMLAAIRALNEEERQQLSSLISYQVPPANVSSVSILDAAIDYIQFERFETEGKGRNRQKLQDLWDLVLERRSEVGGISTTASVSYQEPPADHPESGHGPISIGVSDGLTELPLSSGYTGFQELKLKPAYHDLMNDDRGYPHFSEFDFPNLTLRYYPALKSLTLQQLQFAAMTSLIPSTSLIKGSSWKMDAEIDTPTDIACNECHLFHAEMEWGISQYFLTEQNLIYALLGPYLDFGGSIQRDIRFGPAADVGILLNPLPAYKFRARALIYEDAFQPYRAPGFGTFEVDQSLALSTHWEGRLEGKRTVSFGSAMDSARANSEARLLVQYYF